MIKMKKAFSLIEVIFVLTILGIVASISSQIIVQVYENYITQKALYKTTTKTEIAINQIINRLTFAIDSTTVTKKPHTSTYTTPYTIGSRGENWIKLSDIDISNDNHKQFTTIEWIGYDNDSFSATAAPLWSGVAMYDTEGGATRESFRTPGSDLSSVATIMNNLSNGKVNLTNTNPAAVIFSEKDNYYRTIDLEYDPTCMGLIETNNTSCIFPVRRGTPIATNDNNLTFTRDADANNVALLPKIITERYKLAWSAYALVPEESKTEPGLYDLNLYSNYQPWNNETYTDGDKNLLINNVSVFKFTENGGVIQLKLCATENIGQDFNISSCKEKAIIR
jgi:prepilin-type N-terminal cleavage/methylation domain-containing protein